MVKTPTLSSVYLYERIPAKLNKIKPHLKSELENEVANPELFCARSQELFLIQVAFSQMCLNPRQTSRDVEWSFVRKRVHVRSGHTHRDPSVVPCQRCVKADLSNTKRRYYLRVWTCHPNSGLWLN
ncbi:hypothetical protein NL108_013293 [Boleophthalmus pectinirostris]|nr:hypothetical protein NL108_013293 [Boleophthalmus pectinirostris]